MKLSVSVDKDWVMNQPPSSEEVSCVSQQLPLLWSAEQDRMRTVYSTKLGRVYQADCLELLQSLRSATVDTLFADPPFNLKKQYGKNGGDDLPVAKYLEWSKKWIAESVRVLVPGGALFLYNLPKWLIEYGAYLTSFPEMTFKHWIAVDKAHSLPIPNRLSPSHYGLLYYIKGKKPRVFNRDLVRTPIQTCRHCGKDVKDYGGHKKFLNPKGLNLTDVWDDVPPVRHRKYKNRPANELAPIILERIIKLTTNARDLICDPFAGGGVTAYIAERLKRRWIVADINDCSAIKERLISWEQGSHPEWATNKRRIAEPAAIAERATRALPLLDAITN
jgi:site-specific DNA-methyltransferase (adenine-specific)